jgi:hypothetical protein
MLHHKLPRRLLVTTSSSAGQVDGALHLRRPIGPIEDVHDLLLVVVAEAATVVEFLTTRTVQTLKCPQMLLSRGKFLFISLLLFSINLSSVVSQV